MKNSRPIILLLLIVLITSFAGVDAHPSRSPHHEPPPSNEPDKLQEGSYVIIGVFEYQKNAQRFSAKAKAFGLNVTYKFHEPKGFFYVYVYKGDKKEDAVAQCLELRSMEVFEDAWVLNVSQQENDLDIQATETMKSTGLQPTGQGVKGTAQTPTETAEIESYKMVFRVTNKDDGRTVAADLQVVDGDQASLIADLDRQTEWKIKKDEVPQDTVQLIAEAIGYRKKQLDLSFPPADSNSSSYTSFSNDTLYVDIEMDKLQPGDIQVMYNTYFYGNSSVMREHSRYELEELYKYLQREENIRIRLHGHTNGNSRGKTYLFKEEAKNYFDVMRTREFTKRGVSSRKLSFYRAETIKSYLLSKGIAADRIETIGWGGKKLLYEIDSPQAKNNIRVEIEVLPELETKSAK
ncbi:MAG: OmpA family protein [Cyclobacteriaceae bacterium]